MDSLEDTKMTTEQWPKRSDCDHTPCGQLREEFKIKNVAHAVYRCIKDAQR